MFFKKSQEIKELKKSFQEASALSCWVLITCIELNEDYFIINADLFNNVKSMLDKGLSFSEQGKERVAYVHFKEAIVSLLNNDHTVISEHPELEEAVERLLDLEKFKLTPLWDKYKNNF